MNRHAIATAAGALALVTFSTGVFAGDLAQPPAFSPANDDISDLGAMTASSAWLYNQVAANLSGLLVVALGIALWQSIGPKRRWPAALGAAAVVATGVGTFLDGLFRLDCQGIDTGCVNDSWHAHAHKIESAVTATAVLLTLVLLPLVLRGIAGAHWKPFVAGLPLLFAANIAFSGVGDGAATRAGSVAAFAVLACAALAVATARP
jgi:hypothetical membrane protein